MYLSWNACGENTYYAQVPGGYLFRYEIWGNVEHFDTMQWTCLNATMVFVPEVVTVKYEDHEAPRVDPPMIADPIEGNPTNAQEAADDDIPF